MSSRENTSGTSVGQAKSTKKPKRRRAATPRTKAKKADQVPSPPAKWIVISGGVVKFESMECGPALAFIEKQKLPTSSLYRSSNVAAMVSEATDE